MRLFPVALILLLSWGALAFGGSPTWAAAVVLVLAIATGILGWLERPAPGDTAVRNPTHRAVAIALMLTLASIALQLLPLPRDLQLRLSPARDAVNYEQLLATADRQIFTQTTDPTDERRPISIAASRTQVGLSGLFGLSVLLLGASRGFTRAGTRFTSRAIAFLGVTVTLIGLYQLADGTRRVYGWYVPLFVDASSAPFLNPNHQAGWLLMTMSLCLGAFAGEMARGLRGVAPGWRDRVIWLSTKEASIALVLLFGAAAMAVGILATRARSGAAVLVVVFLMFAWWNSRRQETRLGKTATAAILIAIGIGVLAFNGEAVLREIVETKGSSGRLEIWSDTLRIISDFPLTGTGFNTYGAAMLHYQTLKDGFRYIEAHNDYLQLAAEGGLLVGIPALLLAAVVIREVRLRFRDGLDDTRTYWLRVGAVTGTIAMALQSLIDFTLQMPGAAVMFTTLVAIAIHHAPPRHVPRERERR